MIFDPSDLVSGERVIELAREICAIPSPLGAEGLLGEYIAEVLDRAGAQVHYQEVVAGRPNVIATVEGSGSRQPLVLNGHLDANVHPGHWQRDPYVPWVDHNRLYAGGITDMKGALSAMVAAIEGAAKRREQLAGDLVLQAVMHHDGTGLGTKYALATEGPRAGFAICGEPSNMMVQTANGGALKFEISIAGTTAHICRAEEGLDSIPAAIRAYTALTEHSFSYAAEPRLPDLPRMLVGKLVAGTSPAHVAASAVISGDIRTTPAMTRAKVQAELRSLMATAVSAEYTVRVRIISAHQPFLGSSEGALVTAIAAAHAMARGSVPKVTNELPAQAYVTDAADLVSAGLETVVFGPGEWRHEPDQSILLKDLIDASRIYLSVAMAPLDAASEVRTPE